MHINQCKHYYSTKTLLNISNVYRRKERLSAPYALLSGQTGSPSRLINKYTN